MANQSHRDVLRQGVEAWNAWRKRNPSMDPDLSEANLSEARLTRANLSGADLARADLSGADLSGAYLYEANLRGANLSSSASLGGWGVSVVKPSTARTRRVNFPGANLKEALLTRATLRKANLTRANLFSAHLTEANLSGANLTDANLTYANLNEADLHEADLNGANLPKADITRAQLNEANLTNANLFGADLTRANLSGADLSEAYLHDANLRGADLTGANLAGTNLGRANITRANLTRANLRYCILVETNFEGSTLTNCRIYGISAWDLMLSETTEQSNLVISPSDGNTFATVDDLEVAQFIYLLMDNRKLRNVIETMTSKTVLILGNFAEERKRVLDAIKERLRDRNLLPILFDFEGPDSRDIVETVTTLARLARFIIADLTDPRSVPHELGVIIPDVEVPIVPLIGGTQKPVATFDALRRSHRHRVLELRRYKSSHDLLANFDEKILVPANERFVELENARKISPQEIWVQADGDEER